MTTRSTPLATTGDGAVPGTTSPDTAVDVQTPHEAYDPKEPSAPKRPNAAEERSRRRVWLRRIVLAALIGAAAWFLAQRGSELSGAITLLRRVDWRLVGLAVLFEAASLVVFARIQRWLLLAGGVELPLRTMVEITLAGNAIAATIPGGVAFAAAWAFGQLERRGVNRFLRVWVFLVAGALSSFALFLVVAVGIEVAGGRGPVADLRLAALGLAAIPVAVLIVALVRTSPPVRHAEARIGRVVQRLPGGAWTSRTVRSLVDRLNAVHLSPWHWAEVLGLAVMNWLYDCGVLACCLLALHVSTPWRGLFVIYGVTQIAAALPITPGGLVVVEGTLAALLHAYGVPTEAAIAAVVLYRLVSFWGVVPIGWAVWVSLDLLQQRGRTTRVHPWAVHARQGEAPSTALLPQPAPCQGCDEEAEPASSPVRELPGVGDGSLRPC